MLSRGQFPPQDGAKRLSCERRPAERLVWSIYQSSPTCDFTSPTDCGRRRLGMLSGTAHLLVTCVMTFFANCPRYFCPIGSSSMARISNFRGSPSVRLASLPRSFFSVSSFGMICSKDNGTLQHHPVVYGGARVALQRQRDCFGQRDYPRKLRRMILPGRPPRELMK